MLFSQTIHLAQTESPLRLAIVGTPRSGNTWLRRLLSSILELEEVAVHSERDVDWGRLPSRVAIQLHAEPTPEFQERLRASGCLPVAIARHPLDVLISILQFSQREPETARWIDARGGTEAMLRGTHPCSSAFLRYATSERAEVLLGLTRQWWQLDHTCRVRYESLVEDAPCMLSDVCAQLHAHPRRSPGDVVAENTLDRLRPTSRNNHFWKGTPGFWRRLLPAPLARTIARAHTEHFTALGYACDPDESLTQRAARRHWRRAQSRADESWPASLVQTVSNLIQRLCTDTHTIRVEGRHPRRRDTVPGQ
jgi:hypothetical protein